MDSQERNVTSQISQPKQRLHDKHISLKITGHISSICSSLFSKTKINYFHYGRIYPKGYSLVLVTHPEFHKFFWDQEYDKVVFPYYQEGYCINKCDNKILQEARENFNLDHWLIINKKKNEYIESFGFGTYTGNDQIVEYYLNNQGLLEQFCLYFKEQAKDLIKLSERSLLHTANIDSLKEEKSDDPTDLLNKFLVNKKYLIENNNQEITGITKVEFTILHYLSIGLTAKQIANLMKISFRTVESHLLQIKLKLSAKNKAEIIKKFLSLCKMNPSFTAELIKNIFKD